MNVMMPWWLPSVSHLTPLPDDGPVRDPWDGHDHAPCCPHDAMDRGNCSDCLNTGHAHARAYECSTCNGSQEIELEHQVGAPGSGGIIRCPDCMIG